MAKKKVKTTGTKEFDDYKYTAMTDDQIKEVATGIYKGAIFPSWACKSEREVGWVFMVLSFMSKKSADSMLKNNITFFYEYIDVALPRSVNGMPMFMSLRMADKNDEQRIKDKLIKIKAAMEAL